MAFPGFHPRNTVIPVRLNQCEEKAALRNREEKILGISASHFHQFAQGSALMAISPGLHAFYFLEDYSPAFLCTTS
jgi:hypothetical protein